MPRKLVSVDLQSLEIRAKDAKQLKKLLTSLYSASFKGLSYTGKARFIDRVKRVEIIAHNLDFGLNADLAEARKREGKPRGRCK